MRETLANYCQRTGCGELLAQWDWRRNQPLTPESVTYGSKQKAWWRCEKGHTWQAAVYTRTGSGAGCPVCGGKVPQAGETDLGTLYPDLARQWHPGRNGSLTPADVLPGSRRAAWWICEKGHVWRARIKSRTAGSGCPVCAGRAVRGAENSLASLYPAIAAQWHPEKNGGLTPEEVPPGARRRVWWQCEKGHVWQAAVAARTGRGSGCPVCAGRQVLAGENDLASLYPAIAAQWHPEKNGGLTAAQVPAGSNRKVWWRCEQGHAWQAAVAARTAGGSGCPYCAGRKVLPGFNDLATREPLLAKQWHPTLNGGLTPEMVTCGAHRKVWWQCPEGHVWKTMVYSRAGPRKCGCPVCAGTVIRRPRQPYEYISG